jgi:MoxR-like ATPase
MAGMEASAPQDFQQRIDRFGQLYSDIRGQMHKVIVAQQEVVEQVLTCLIASGHALLEGVPGLGKTLLAQTLSRVVDVKFSRIQFTPDLMPADITGTNVLETAPGGDRTFRFQPGPIFANLVLADEINRATPKTQSAVLEAMQERTVSLAGTTRPLPEPFFVLATQNPIEMEGTYPLPEAQLDRFLLKVHIAAGGRDDLADILARTTGPTLPEPETVCGAEQILRMQATAREVIAGDHIHRRVADLVLATDPGNGAAPERVRRYVRFGASPRGAQAVLLAAKVRALADGRANVDASDIRQVYLPALRHRILLSFEGQADNVRPDDLLREVFEATS